MTRRLAALLLGAAALVAVAGPASAAGSPVELQRTHVVCVGGSNDPSSFEGVCVWVPLPV